MLNFLKKKKKDDFSDLDDFPESPFPNANAQDSGLPPMQDDTGLPPMDMPAPDFGTPMNNQAAPPQQNAFNPESFAPPRPISPPQPAPVEQATQSNTNGDKIEVVLAKLDTLKSMIEMLNQRITTLEHQIKEDKKRW